MRNNILGAVVYLSTAIVFGGSTALLMLLYQGEQRPLPLL